MGEGGYTRGFAAYDGGMHPTTRAAPFHTASRRHEVCDFRAVIFDMDGVVTDTAQVHAAAWKKLFDGVLDEVGQLPENREAVSAEPHRTAAFDVEGEYLQCVDGLPREEGVRSFFASRGLSLAEGELSVDALAERKQRYFDEVLQEEGVTVFPDALKLLRQLRAAGIPIGLVTSSRNAHTVLSRGEVIDLFDHIVDGSTAAQLKLPGKPHPDTFLHAARLLGVEPQDTAVLEDAVSGVQAAVAGDFSLVVGVDRHRSPQRLRDAGALVVEDISALELQDCVTRPYDPAWVLAYDSFDPAEEGTREALCTLANGYWGTRGSVPGTQAGTVHYPGTYVAGVFNRLVSIVQGREVETEHLVNMPDWTVLSATPAGAAPLLPTNGQLIEYHQELDLRRGLLARIQRYQDSEGRITKLATRQFQSLADRHLAGLEMSVEAENWSGEITLRSMIDGRVANRNVADDHQLSSRHLQPEGMREVDGSTVLLEMMTNSSQVRVAVAARTRVTSDADGSEASRRLIEEGADVAGHDIDLHLDAGVPVTLEKIAAISTSQDPALATTAESAAARVSRAPGFRRMLNRHEERCGIIWARAAVHMDYQEMFSRDDDQWAGLDYDCANERHQLALHLHTFHVLQTAFGSHQETDVALGARGLHGEGYRGHIFWDELFVYPALTLRRPEFTRGLLMYRYRRLNEARANASAEGCPGAMYPWQSGSTGREETPSELWNPRSQMWMPDNSHNQRHVSLAVAYSVLRYFEATGDETFISDFGGEMLVEICRFFVSLAHRSPDSDRWEIHGVMGPDEYHDGYPDTPGSGLRNNAYTNVLTSWTLTSTVRLLRWMDGRDDPLRRWLDVFEDELRHWEDIATHLKVPFMEDGVISQFDGYEDLLEFDWDDYRARYDNIGRLDLILQAEGDSTNRYKLTKQADVLMLPYLFSKQELQETLATMGYEFPVQALHRTVDHYLRRTSHGSTLSRLVHGWVAARTDRAAAWALFTEALEADLSDTQGGTTREGIHLGAMAGTVDMVIRCFAGVETRNDTLRLHPQLPKELPGVQFKVRFRHQTVDVDITHQEVTVTLPDSSSQPIHLSIEGRDETMAPGETCTVALLNSG